MRNSLNIHIYNSISKMKYTTWKTGIYYLKYRWRC